MATKAPYPYRGPENLREAIAAALREVVDPEVAMSIVDVGLVYDVLVEKGDVVVTMTMTSAACPVTDAILDDVQHELEQALPAAMRVEVRLVWAPPWSPSRMGDRGRAVMGW